MPSASISARVMGKESSQSGSGFKQNGPGTIGLPVSSRVAVLAESERDGNTVATAHYDRVDDHLQAEAKHLRHRRDVDSQDEPHNTTPPDCRDAAHSAQHVRES